MRAVIGAVFAKCDLSINRAPGNLIPFVFIKTDLPSAWSVPGTVLEALLTLPLGSLKVSSRQVERCHREKQRGWESPWPLVFPSEAAPSLAPSEGRGKAMELCHQDPGA